MTRTPCLIPALLLVLTTASAASADPSTLCDAAAAQAAATTGVPVDLLRAVSRAETGRDDGIAIHPWPWAINHDGQGTWFEDEVTALAKISEILDAGGSLDIGCFQINTHWHGDAFTSPAQMLDPTANALYAARYLSELHAESGDWGEAIAAYHSRDPDRGAGYLDRVALLYEVLPANVPPTRINSFPLLLAGDPATGGSLVPRLPGLTPLIGAP